VREAQRQSKEQEGQKESEEHFVSMLV